MEEYDVVVVGAGPAGAYCAYKLSEIGHDVLLIDRNKKIGEPNFSSGGTVMETVEKFKLPKKIIQSYWKSLKVISPKRSCEINFERRMGCVLDYKSLVRHFVSLAEKNGCDVMRGVPAKDVCRDDGKISGVSLYDDGDVRADVVVDATGTSNVLGSKLGLAKSVLVGHGFGIEYLMKNVDLDDVNRLDFYLGDSFVPHGYGWVFPAGNDSAKVGVGMILNKNKTTLNPFLKKFVNRNVQMKNAVVLDFHGGVLCFKPFVRKYSMDNFLAIGDAAGQVNPLGGEGIKHALYSGDFAAKTISKCIDANDFSENMLSGYDVMCKSYVGTRWIKSALMAKFFYGLINDQRADRFVNYLSHMGSKDIFEALFYYKFNIIRNLIRVMRGVVV